MIVFLLFLSVNEPKHQYSNKKYKNVPYSILSAHFPAATILFWIAFRRFPLLGDAT